METTEEIKTTVTKTIHHIYCDKCGKHITDSYEHDDGYYYEPSRYEIEFSTMNGGCALLLCDDCCRELSKFKEKQNMELIELFKDNEETYKRMMEAYKHYRGELENE